MHCQCDIIARNITHAQLSPAKELSQQPGSAIGSSSPGPALTATCLHPTNPNLSPSPTSQPGSHLAFPAAVVRALRSYRRSRMTSARAICADSETPLVLAGTRSDCEAQRPHHAAEERGSEGPARRCCAERCAA
eukprot:376178-Rhodomonas_salina.2